MCERSVVITPWARVLLGVAGTASYLLLLGVADALTNVDLVRWSPPFGASLVLIFFSRAGAETRSWDVVAGHVVAAVCATAMGLLCVGLPAVVRSAVVIPASILAMSIAGCFHRPAIVTALMTQLAPARPLDFGITPVLLNGVALVLVRKLVELAERRRART